MFRPLNILQRLLTRNYARRASNPGIDRRLRGLGANKSEIPDPEQFEDSSESDFHNIHEMHKVYEKETDEYREKMKHWIVKNKYFKRKQLNFLTWAEKEQIRYLFEQDPEEWGFEKLAESFPADVETISKIIKSKWYPQDNSRISKHDLSVKTNWDLYKSNKIEDLDLHLRQHLKKFAHRNFAENAQPKIEPKLIMPEPPNNEFSSIITSCKKYALTELEAGEEIKQIEESTSKEVFVPKKFRDSRPVTFKQLKIGDSTIGGQDENLIVLNSVNNPGGTGVVIKSDSNVDMFKVKKFDSVSVAKSTESSLKSQVTSEVKEFIKIPKNLKKNGATYQLDDCFYDDDGEFLYRVPGMTGKLKK